MNVTIKESVMKGIAYIESNLYKNIGVIDVANSVSYSQFYFSREFSKHTHISIYDYILRRKITESYKELLNSGSKILDIAFRYGFQSHEVYTRAFRKVFGENPSKAVIYKPLAIYQPIDEQYLEFLNGLKVEIKDEVIEDSFFEVSSISELDDGNNFIILLSRENLYQCNCIFKGDLIDDRSKFLSFKVTGLKLKLRIHNTDTKLSYRYFFDYIYDVDKMSCNYILIKKMNDCIDFIVPTKS